MIYEALLTASFLAVIFALGFLLEATEKKEKNNECDYNNLQRAFLGRQNSTYRKQFVS